MYYIKYIIFILIIIIISSIIYYLYIKNNVENFSCDIRNLTGGKIDSRQCAVYFTDDIRGCDATIDFYKKGITQLDILIYRYSNSSNTNDNALAEKLIKVKEDKLANINSCKIELKNWKEINNYYTVDDKPDLDGIIPRKSTNMSDKTNVIDNILLSGTCLKEYNYGDQINTINDDIFQTCDYYPITNIRDESDPQGAFKNYVGIDIKLSQGLSFSSLNENICTNSSLAPSVTRHQINEDLIFTKIQFVMNNNILKIKNIRFVEFDTRKNNFQIINNEKRIQDKINTFFRYYYDTVSKNIMYGPKTFQNVTDYILEYNNCGDIDNITMEHATFSLSDFNFREIIVKSYDQILNDLDIGIDDTTIDYKNPIIQALTAKFNSIQKSIDDLNINIRNIDSDIESLDKSVGAKNAELNGYNSKATEYALTITTANCDSLPDKIVDTVARDAAIAREKAAKDAEDERLRIVKAAKDAEDERLRIVKAAKDAEDERLRKEEEAINNATKIDISNLSYNEIYTKLKKFFLNAKNVVNDSSATADEKNKANDKYTKIIGDLDVIKLVIDFSYSKIKGLNNPSEIPSDSFNKLAFTITDAYASSYDQVTQHNTPLNNLLYNFYKTFFISVERKDVTYKASALNANIKLTENYTNIFNISTEIMNVVGGFYAEYGKGIIIGTASKRSYDLKNIEFRGGIRNMEKLLNKFNDHTDDINFIKNNIIFDGPDYYNEMIMKFVSVMGELILDKNILMKIYKSDNKRDISEDSIYTTQFSIRSFAIMGYLPGLLISQDASIKYEFYKIIYENIVKYADYYIGIKESFTNYNIEPFTNYIEKFAVYDADYMITNTAKTTCKTTLNSNKDLQTANNEKITQCNEYITRLSRSLQVAGTQKTNMKNEKNNLLIYLDKVNTLILSFNKIITLAELNNIVQNTSILNYTNYINNISNDDCIYFI